MKPGRLDLVIEQGGTFRRRFVWKRKATPTAIPRPRDLTGAIARSQIRVNGNPVLTFDSDSGASPDGTITFGDADGWIELLADDDVVSAVTPGSGVWSLEVKPSGEDRVVLLKGDVTILAEVTE